MLIIKCSFCYISLKPHQVGTSCSVLLPLGVVLDCNLASFIEPPSTCILKIYMSSLGDGFCPVDISVTEVVTHDASGGDQHILVL